MNLGKSIKVACAQCEILQKDVAKKVCLTPEYLSVIVKRSYCGTEMLISLSDVFDMKVSEFIALGE